MKQKSKALMKGLMLFVVLSYLMSMVSAGEAELSSSSSSSSIASSLLSSSSSSSTKESSLATSSVVSSSSSSSVKSLGSVSSSWYSSSSSSSSLPDAGAIRQAQTHGDMIFPAFIVAAIGLIVVGGFAAMTGSMEIISLLVAGITLLMGIIICGYLISVL